MPSYTARELERETGVDRRTIAYYVQEGLLPRVGRRGRRTRYPKLFRDRLLFIQRVRDAEEEGHVSAVSLKDIRKVFERVPPALIARVADGRIAVTPELVSEPSTAFRTPGMRRAMLRERWEGEERAMSPMRGPPALDAPLFSPGAPAEHEDWGEDDAGPREGDMVAHDEGPAYSRMPGPPAEEPEPYASGPSDAEPPLEEAPRRSAPRRRAPQREVDVPPVYSRLPERHESGAAEELALASDLRRLEEVARRRIKESPRSRDTWTRIDVSPHLVLSARGIGEEDVALVERVRRAMKRVIWRGR
ncbi:MAG: MerR family transcriptional regulator [Gemmatimonadetes bacterium]|nr:MerR family transcriptional regulator [Gemmatimonadota bacterium]MYJ12556.1 MerR family transcriptional regulator [Gemmatimonadota bacterium]